jgi:hypothetical protein
VGWETRPATCELRELASTHKRVPLIRARNDEPHPKRAVFCPVSDSGAGAFLWARAPLRALEGGP